MASRSPFTWALVATLTAVQAAPAQPTVLTRRVVSNAAARNAVCNDGTPPVYFTSLVPGATRWMLYLEGGAGCYNEASCADRLQNYHYLVSSTDMNGTLEQTGPFQRDCSLNPALCNANLAFVHYCTSDWWVGTAQNSSAGVPFLGKYVVRAVVEEVTAMPEFQASATQLLLAGLSAGGIGVLQNADYVASLLADLAPTVELKAFADSAWFMGGPSLEPSPCTDSMQCNQEETFIMGVSLWQAHLQDACANAVPPALLWKCLFGYNVHRYIQTDLFTAHLLMDWWQAKQDGVTASPSAMTATEMRWVLSRGAQNAMLTTQATSRAYFALNCFEHSLTNSRRFWARLINGTSISEALAAWYDGQVPQLIDSTKYLNGNPTCDDPAAHVLPVESLNGKRRMLRAPALV